MLGPSSLALTMALASGITGAGLVVIGDDAIDTHLAGGSDFIDRGDTAIDRDQKIDLPFFGFLKAVLGDAVALDKTIGKIVRYRGAKAVQDEEHQSRAGDAIDIVIAVDHDLFVGLEGLNDTIDRDIHLGHHEGIEEIGKIGIEEFIGCEDWIEHTARHQVFGRRFRGYSVPEPAS